MPDELQLHATLRHSTLDGRRGIVRVHQTVLAALGARPWTPLRLTGRRTTGALAALTDVTEDPRLLVCDDVTLANLGVADGGPVTVSIAEEQTCASVTVTGPEQVMEAVSPDALRFALLGKAVTDGDRVSLLPQDFSLPADAGHPAERTAAMQKLSKLIGSGWSSVLLAVRHASPAGPAIVTMATSVGWLDGPHTTASTLHAPAVPEHRAAPSHDGAPAVSTTGRPALPAVASQLASLSERFDVAFRHTELLASLGGQAQLGVLVTGPAGSGKAAMVEAATAAVGATLLRVWAPGVAALEPNSGAQELMRSAEQAIRSMPAVLLVEDVEALAPRDSASAPLLARFVEVVGALVAAKHVAVVATSARPELVSRELMRPGMLDVQIAVPLPTRDVRRAVLAQQTAAMPLEPDVDLDDVAGRTPGFVAADLLALCREAAVRAADRHAAAGHVPGAPAGVAKADFDAALEVVRPTSMGESTLELPDLTLDDVGDMAETKTALTESVLWPLQYPETFERLGVPPPKGVLLYGPPGCGKTFLVKAIAGTGQANVLSVKGSELLTKWVGESERGVRDMFRRAREAAPALIFMDEIDALAPTRGQGTDSGVSDRVVAALLTELDGIEELRNVVVVAATNRPDLIDPALLRPGRLDRLVFVPPPDAEARAEILKAAARKVPLADDVDLAALAHDTDGYSSADCAALLREAALAAMRESHASTVVTGAHLAVARQRVRPSLRAEQVEALRAFAARH